MSTTDPAVLKQAVQDTKAAHAKASTEAAVFRKAWRAAAVAFGLEPAMHAQPSRRSGPTATPVLVPVPTLEEMTKYLAATVAANAAEIAARKAHQDAEAALQVWLAS